MGDKSVSVTLKKRWKTSGSRVGLREFAKSLADEGDVMAKNWFANKKGACDQGRSPANITRATLESSATKMSRSKKSMGNKKTSVG